MDQSLRLYKEFEDIRNAYIVGGMPAKQAKIPWQVSLQQYDPPGWFRSAKWRHICGGTIISQHYVITAAHCIPTNIEDLRVVAGVVTLKDESMTAQYRHVEKAISHPDYDAAMINHDIALVKVTEPFIFINKVVQPAKLSTKKDVFRDNSPCMTSGWGRTRQNGVLSNELLYVPLPLTPWDDCYDSYKSVKNAEITHNKLCAGKIGVYGHGVCQGDSGGPLICRNEKGHMKLAGITSFGVICGSATHPTVFTKISAYQRWITRTMQDNRPRIKGPP